MARARIGKAEVRRGARGVSAQAAARTRSTLGLIARAAAPAAALLIIAYFAIAAVVGENGLLKFGDYRRAKAAHEAELAGLRAEQARLRHRAALLDPRRVDPDYADELVRRRTDQVREDEVILRTR